MSDERVLLDVQEDILAKLLSEEALAGINIVLQRKLLTERVADVSFVWMTERNEKLGAGLLIAMPFITDEAKETGVSDSTVVIPIFAFEHPDTAQSTDKGSGINAETLALLTRKILRGFVLDGVMSLFTEGKSIVAAEPPEGITDVICYQVEMRGRWRSVTESRVATPTISAAALTVTLACSTGGAEIWFTEDNSFPGAGNLGAQGDNLVPADTLFEGSGYEVSGLEPGKRYIVTTQFGSKSAFVAGGATHTLTGTEGEPVPSVRLATAQIYGDPFNVESGTVLRFAAYKTGLSGSHAIKRTITN